MTHFRAGMLAIGRVDAQLDLCQDGESFFQPPSRGFRQDRQEMMMMNNPARGTLPRTQKGPAGPAPELAGPLKIVADAVSSWPGIATSVHWYLLDQTQVDGVDFYLGEQELGHLHLDGAIHLATSPDLGKALVAEGKAKPFRYQKGWVEQTVGRIGADAAVALFRRNYDHLQA